MFLKKWVKTYLEVSITVKSQTLKHNQSNYNDYQIYLYELCTDLHKSGLGYRKISYFCNEHQILSVKGCDLKNNHIFSIIKKGTVRLERINSLKSHKDYNIQINDVLVTYEDLNISDYQTWNG